VRERVKVSVFQSLRNHKNFNAVKRLRDSISGLRRYQLALCSQLHSTKRSRKLTLSLSLFFCNGLPFGLFNNFAFSSVEETGKKLSFESARKIRIT
jgi:hypothetical protein